MICDDNNKAAQNFCLAHFHFSSFCSLQEREVQKGFKKTEHQSLFQTSFLMMKKVLRFSAKEENEKLYHSRRSEEF